MDSLDTVLARLQDERHKKALSWFWNNKEKIIPYSEITSYADQGSLLTSKAKGIYKPIYTDYALSVKQTLGGPYDDKELDYKSDGSWTYRYFQEGKVPAERDKRAANRGLMKCMKDAIPVGVLRQKEKSPVPIYEIMGLAYVTDWKDGYFTLHKF